MWYVLKVSVGRENELAPDIERALSDIGDCTAFSPRYVSAMRYKGEWHMKKESLFPGYVFVSTELDNAGDMIKDALKIFASGVSPVCIGGGFYPIRMDEQLFLENMMNSGHEIGFSIGDIIDGELVIRQGPLAGRTNIIRRIDRHHRKADISVMLWNREQRVSVGLEVKRKN